MSKQYLIPDLIPKTSWFDNLRSVLSQDEWDVVRKAAYRIAGYQCEICGGSGLVQGFDWPVECHERWEFDDAGWTGLGTIGTQYLTGVQALCPMCHKVKHFGFSTVRDAEFASRGRDWLAKVNDWSVDVADVALKGCFRQWNERSRKQWIVDYSRAPQEIQEMVKGIVDGRQRENVRYEPREYRAQMELSELTVRQISALQEAARQQMEKFMWSKLNNAFSFDPVDDPEARNAVKKTIGEGSVALRGRTFDRVFIDDTNEMIEKSWKEKSRPAQQLKPRPIRKLRLEE